MCYIGIMRTTDELEPVAHLTMQDLATRLGVPLQTVRVWRTKNYGPRGMTIGRHIRYRLVDVEAWEQGQVEK